MSEENKKLKIQRSQKIGKIIFWIGTVIVMVGMLLIIFTPGTTPGWELYAMALAAGIIVVPGFFLALIGLRIKKRRPIKLILIFVGGCFIAILSHLLYVYFY